MVMNFEPAQSQAQPTAIWTGNLRSVFLKSTQLERLRDSFKEFARNASLNAAQLSMLQEYATPSAKDMVSGDPSFAWHFFSDYLKKRVSVLEMNPAGREGELLLESVVYMGWTAHNFPMVFKIPPLNSAAPFPAGPQDIPDAPAALGYIKYSVIPALKKDLSIRFGLSDVQVDGAIHDLSGKLMRKSMGVEILRPIPPSVWKFVSGKKNTSAPHP